MASEPWNDIATLLGGYPQAGEIASELWGEYVQRNLDRLYSPPGVQCNASSTLSLPNSVESQIPWTGTDTWDTDGFHSTLSSGLVRIPAGLAGIYRTEAMVLFAGSTAGTHRQLSFYVNGTKAIQHNYLPNAALQCYQISHELFLDDGDELEVRAWQNTGGNLNIHHSSYYYLSKWTTRWVAPFQL